MKKILFTIVLMIGVLLSFADLCAQANSKTKYPNPQGTLRNLSEELKCRRFPFPARFTAPETSGTASYSYDKHFFDVLATETGTKEKKVFELPFYDNFSDGEQANAFYTFFDPDHDGHDNLSMWFWKEDEKLMQFCSDNQRVGNDWLITPAIHLDAKNLYQLGFTINMGAVSNLKVTLGTSSDPKDHVAVMDLNGIEEYFPALHSATLKVAEEGEYYVGFYAYSGLESSYLNLFDIKLEAGIPVEIPDSVHHLQVIPAENGRLSARLTFNAPDTLVNGVAIAGNFQVTIYRDDQSVGEIPVTAGQSAAYTDENPPAGNHTYRLVAVQDDRVGLSVSRNVWIGPDLPAPVENLKAKTIDGNMHVLLEWDAPEKGAHDGYFDSGDLTYSVWRSNTGEEFTEIKSGLTQRMYTDLQIEQELGGLQDSYYYAVTAKTHAGEGEARTKFIVVGTPYKLPASESFENGQFNIYPWTTESVEGSYSWECLHDDKAAEVYPQDTDYGFIKFHNTWTGAADSRLKTPVLDLNGSRNPSFSFFMFHWNEKDVEDDDKQTKLSVEISVDGRAFEPVGDVFTAAAEREGWAEHRISLAAYKNAGQVQLSLRGSTDNNWMYYYVDNIHFEEQEDADLAVLSFTGTETAELGEKGMYTLRYFNRGLKTASGYSAVLYQDGVLVGSMRGEDLQPGEIRSVDFEILLNAAKAGKTSEFYAEIVYEADGIKDNNRSLTVVTTVKDTWYPGIGNLSGTAGGGQTVLSWTPPVIPTQATETQDGVEDYEPFAIRDIGRWITFDGDGLGSGALTGIPAYPNQGTSQAFLVWAPGLLDGFDAEAYPSLLPRTGEQCFISWYANVRVDGVSPRNDDYLISPEVLGGTDIGFYIRRIDEDAAEETYELLYSATTPDPEAFELLKAGEAPSAWEKVTATLPADARYFAIRYTASDQYGILVDDIAYTSALSGLKIKGYNVFRDEQQVNDALLVQPSFSEPDVSGTHLYSVSVVYDRGESPASAPVRVSASSIRTASAGGAVYTGDGRITVVAETPRPVSVYTVEGQCLDSRIVAGTACFPVEEGLYIVRAGDQVTKVFVGR